MPASPASRASEDGKTVFHRKRHSTNDFAAGLGQASLGDLSELIHALSKQQFHAKVRPDHRMCVIENRELIWTSQVATLLNLAIGDSALRQVPIGYG